MHATSVKAEHDVLSVVTSCFRARTQGSHSFPQPASTGHLMGALDKIPSLEPCDPPRPAYLQHSKA